MVDLNRRVGYFFKVGFSRLFSTTELRSPQVTGASIRHENESADVMNNMFKRSRQKKS